jgi:hypothetical protein
MTAKDLMAKLEADPEFVARHAERERRLQKEEVELRTAERPLINELRSVGY